MASGAKTVIDSFREAVQDLLVPELKALRVSVDSVRTEMQLRDDKLQESIDSVRTEMQLRDERTQEMIRHLDERTQESIRRLDERTQESIKALSQKLDYALDVRERLAALEARLPRQ